MGGVASVLTTATAAAGVAGGLSSLANVIIATLQGSPGIVSQVNNDSFVFDYEGENTLTLQADSTDHYAEDNQALQDNIALRPKIITTQGFVGELNDVLPGALVIAKAAAEKLSTITPYLPSLSVEALLAFQEVQSAYNIAKSLLGSVTDVLGALGNSGQKKTAQQKAYEKFEGFYKSRNLFTVQCPWGVFNDCAIILVRATQDADNAYISTFDVTFKQMRFAQSITLTNPLDPNSQGRTAVQFGDTVNNGRSSVSAGPSLGTANARFV